METDKSPSSGEHPEVEYYGDEGIVSNNAPIPRWLKFNYGFWVLFGLVWFYLYWNGEMGWLDRGYWNELQRAANTVYPFNTTELIERAAQAELADKPKQKE